MPVIIEGLIEDVEKFDGKNGFGANVTVSSKVGKKTKRITFIIRDEAMANRLDDLIDINVIIKIELNQNNFGLRFGLLYSVDEVA